MDYEKKYKEALEKARRLQNGEGVEVLQGDSIVEALFPELKESEDEKIRSEIMQYLWDLYHKDFCPPTPSIDTCDKWLAWLEKQGDVSKAYELGFTEGKRIKNKEWLEKQGEQKPTDKGQTNKNLQDNDFRRMFEQKPIEWSEEDLICLGYLADFVDKNGDDFYGENKPNVVKWIRSFAELQTHNTNKRA